MRLWASNKTNWIGESHNWEIMPSKNQVDHLFCEINKTIKDGNKVLVTTLTKRMAEELTEFYKEKDLKSRI